MSNDDRVRLSNRSLDAFLESCASAKKIDFEEFYTTRLIGGNPLSDYCFASSGAGLHKIFYNHSNFVRTSRAASGIFTSPGQEVLCVLDKRWFEYAHAVFRIRVLFMEAIDNEDHEAQEMIDRVSRGLVTSVVIENLINQRKNLGIANALADHYTVELNTFRDFCSRLDLSFTSYSPTEQMVLILLPLGVIFHETGHTSHATKSKWERFRNMMFMHWATRKHARKHFNFVIMQQLGPNLFGSHNSTNAFQKAILNQNSIDEMMADYDALKVIAHIHKMFPSKVFPGLFQDEIAYFAWWATICTMIIELATWTSEIRFVVQTMSGNNTPFEKVLSGKAESIARRRTAHMVSSSLMRRLAFPKLHRRKAHAAFSNHLAQNCANGEAVFSKTLGRAISHVIGFDLKRKETSSKKSVDELLHLSGFRMNFGSRG